MRSIKELLELWNIFGDIAVDDEGNIETPFLEFESGTDREVIWSWFEEQNPAFSVGVLMEFGESRLYEIESQKKNKELAKPIKKFRVYYREACYRFKDFKSESKERALEMADEDLEYGVDESWAHSDKCDDGVVSAEEIIVKGGENNGY